MVHLAALSNDPVGNLNPQLTYDINHLASVRMARLAKEAGVTPLCFFLFVQHVWRGGRRLSGRNFFAQSGDSLR